MSATKNLIMTYEEMIGKNLDDFTDKDFLKIETTDILQNTALPCDPQTIEFFDAIYGSDNRTDLKRWIMEQPGQLRVYQPVRPHPGNLRSPAQRIQSFLHARLIFRLENGCACTLHTHNIQRHRRH